MNSVAAMLLTLVSASEPSPRGEVLNFSATWCGPCRQVAPLVERLKRQGYPIRKVDVDQNSDLAGRYGIRSVPQFLLVVDGKVVERLQGVQSESGLKRLMAKIPEPKSMTEETTDTLIAESDKPTRVLGIPIPFLGETASMEAETPQTVRGQNEFDVAFVTETGPITKEPMEASVRINVSNNGSVSHGSGTVIYSDADKALILTCGHLFRGSTQSTRIEVDLITDGKLISTHVAQVLDFDDRADVGLISIDPGRVIAAISIGGEPLKVEKGDLVFSVGCGNGDDPTKWQMFVKDTFLSRGNSITECTQAPVQGRSGGGLFNRYGELIGICMAADPKRNTGLYAGLSEIHKLLAKTSLASLYQRQSAPEKNQPAQLADAEPFPESKRTDATENPFGEEVELKPVVRAAASQPSELSETEVNAIAAALQFSGPLGVTVKIEARESSPQSSRILIVTRGMNSDNRPLQPEKPGTLSAAIDSRVSEMESSSARLDWANDLERGTSTTVSQRQTSFADAEPSAGSPFDLEDWGNDTPQFKVFSEEASPFRRSVR